jgi:hypothetical protein
MYSLKTSVRKYFDVERYVVWDVDSAQWLLGHVWMCIRSSIGEYGFERGISILLIINHLLVCKRRHVFS